MATLLYDLVSTRLQTTGGPKITNEGPLVQSFGKPELEVKEKNP